MIKYPPSKCPRWWSLVEAKVHATGPKAKSAASMAWLFDCSLLDSPPVELAEAADSADPDAAISETVIRVLPNSLRVEVGDACPASPYRPNFLGLVLAGNVMRWGFCPTRASRNGECARLSLKSRRAAFCEVLGLSDGELRSLPGDALAWFAMGAMAAGFGGHSTTKRRFQRLLTLLSDEHLARLPGWTVDAGAPLGSLCLPVAELRRRHAPVPARLWPREVVTECWGHGETVFYLAEAGGTFSDDLLAAARLTGRLASYPDLERRIDPDAAFRTVLARLETLTSTTGEGRGAPLVEFTNAHAEALRAVGSRPEVDTACRRILEVVRKQRSRHLRSAWSLLYCAASCLDHPCRMQSDFAPVIEDLARAPGASAEAVESIREKFGIDDGVSPLRDAVDRMLSSTTGARLLQAEWWHLLRAYHRPALLDLLQEALVSGPFQRRRNAILLVAQLVRDAAIRRELGTITAKAQRASMVSPQEMGGAAWELDRAIQARCRRLDGRQLAALVADQHVEDGTPPPVARAMQALLENGPQQRLLHILFAVEGTYIRRMPIEEAASLFGPGHQPQRAGKTLRVVEVVGWGRGAASLTKLDEIVTTEVVFGTDGSIRSELEGAEPHMRIRHAGRSVPLNLFEAQFLRRRYPLTQACEGLVRQRLQSAFDAGAESRRQHVLLQVSQVNVKGLFALAHAEGGGTLPQRPTETDQLPV